MPWKSASSPQVARFASSPGLVNRHFNESCQLAKNETLSVRYSGEMRLGLVARRLCVAARKARQRFLDRFLDS